MMYMYTRKIMLTHSTGRTSEEFSALLFFAGKQSNDSDCKASAGSQETSSLSLAMLSGNDSFVFDADPVTESSPAVASKPEGASPLLVL